ncbi:MAG: hypothetical protein V3R54_06030 [Thermodesulfovibrionia bacterium]
MNEWIDKNEYPFQSNYFEVPAGRMYYVDEGEGFPDIIASFSPGYLNITVLCKNQ